MGNVDKEKQALMAKAKVISKSYLISERLKMMDDEKLMPIFAYDPDPIVRYECVKKGKDEELGVLVHDSDWHVRRAVALYGRPQDLDQLINDDNIEVVKAVASQRRKKDLSNLAQRQVTEYKLLAVQYGDKEILDLLRKDKSWIVRFEVARKGRPEDLKVLAHDANSGVRYIAKLTLKEKEKALR